MRKGFTLVEGLVVAAAVLVLLQLVILAAQIRARHQPRMTTCKEQVHALGVALMQYRNDYSQQWPSSAMPAAPALAWDVNGTAYGKANGPARPGTFDHGDEGATAAAAHAQWFWKSRNALAKLYPDYADSTGFFDCPSGNPADAAVVFRDGTQYRTSTAADTGPAPATGQPQKTVNIVENPDYVLDDDIRGGPMRAILGDLNDDDHGDAAGAEPTGLSRQEGTNHPNGSLVLFLDGSCTWADQKGDGTHPNPWNEKMDPDVYRDNGGAPDDASLEENN